MLLIACTSVAVLLALVAVLLGMLAVVGLAFGLFLLFALVGPRSKVLFAALAAYLFLLPLHIVVTDLGAPAWWKEAAAFGLLGVTIVVGPARFRNPVTVPIVAFMALVLTLGIYHGRVDTYDLSPYLGFIPLAFVIPSIVRSTRHVTILALGVASASSLNAIVVIVAQARNADIVVLESHQSTTIGRIRPSSFIGPNLLTATLLGLVASAVIAFVWIARDRRRSIPKVTLGFGVLSVCGAASTLSRGALIAPAVTAIITLIVLALRQPRHRKGSLFAGAALLSVSLILLLGSATRSSTVIAHYSEWGASSDLSNSMRIQRWREASQLAAASPIVGNGPGYTGLSRIHERYETIPDYIPANVAVPISESNWLKIAAELGILGIVSSVAIVMSAARILWRRARQYPDALVVLVVLLTAVVHGAGWQSMESYIGSAIFWALVGLAGSYHHLGSPSRASAEVPLRDRKGPALTPGVWPLAR